MKRAILILLSMLLMVIGASGQNRQHQNGRENQHRFEQRDQRGRKGDRGLQDKRKQHKDRNIHDVMRRQRNNHGQRNNRHRNQNMSHGRGDSHGHVDRHGSGSGNSYRSRSREVYCTEDRQELWNGCHVRVKMGRIHIITRLGDRLVWADEVILLPTGHYLTRNGDFWYVLTEYGVRLGNVWGDFIELMPDGIFHCQRAGINFYYDQYGNERL